MNGLLSDVRILDLTRMLAGPYGTMLLADMGAEVIKIEDHAGDFTRIAGHMAVDGTGIYFLSINRNKKSMVLDLKTQKGREVFYDLVRVADVVVDNMRPAALKKLGCDFDVLEKINPHIISCSISGFGHTGPYRNHTAFDLTIQAISGAMSVTGEPGRPPARMGFAVADVAGGVFGALAIVSALHRRQTTGRGQKLDISLLDCQISFASYLVTYCLTGGLVPGPQGSSHESVVPYQAFQTKDSWLVVTCVTPRMWEGLCRVLGREELIEDERFSDGTKRMQNRQTLIPLIQEAFLQQTTDHWLERLNEQSVPCAPVNTLDKTLSDPQVAERNMVVEIPAVGSGAFQAVGNPIKASGSGPETFRAPPALGEHTDEILRELLEYSPDRIEALRSEKII